MTVQSFVRRAVLAALLVGVPVAGFSQSSQTGIAGVVKDSSGAVLPGVTVEAASDALIEKVRSVTSDGNGQYRVVDLRPGTYVVTFTLPGFSTVRREGIELRADFTATVNGELSVGQVAETITVSGAAPLVDVQSTAKSVVFAKEVLDGLPNNRQIQSLAQVVPGVIGGLNIDGPASRNLTVHGSRGGDTNSAIDGMSDRRGSTGGSGVTFYMNEGSVQEMSIQTDGGNAEAQLAGVWMNAIPKEGGNTFHGQVVGLFANDALSTSNLTDALRAQGLKAVNGLKRTWDFNPNGGGAIIKDKLWYYGAYRNNQIDKFVANSYFSTDPLAWVSGPQLLDLSRQGIDTQVHQNYAYRFTWQATPRNKVSLGFERDRRRTPYRRIASTVSPEATTWTPFFPNEIYTLVWKAPLTSKLLIDTGFMSYQQDWDERRQINPLVGFDTISVTESSTGLIYRSSPVYGHNFDNPLTVRSSLSYVTGTHNIKAGFTLRSRGNGPTYNNVGPNQSLTYTFRNGAPSSLTEYANIETYNDLKADMGIFAQDSWTFRGATINYGLRFDYLNAGTPAQSLAAGRFVPAREFAPVENLPNWKDINPRVGLSYDLFHNGKTALKASAGRYVTGGSLAQTLNPVNTSVNSTNRTWADANRNFIPDCNFTIPTANGECGALANLNFGKSNPNATQWDKNVTEGWGVRPYSWSTGIGIQHQVMNGMSIDAGYYRRWYGNFTVTRNTSVNPATDYDPYCITAPSNDPRLPVAGQKICGFYDLKPAKFGQVQNIVQLAKNYGNQTDIYDGVDLSANWRIQKLTLFGALNVGREATNSCFVVNSPQDTFQTAAVSCNQVPPFLKQWKAYGLYNLPFGVSLSGTFQAIPTPAAANYSSITADYNATNAEIAPSLGRNLSSGAAGTVLVQLLDPFVLNGGHAKQLDMRLGKTLQAGKTRVRLSLDIYNVLNSNDMQALTTRFSSNNATNNWQQPTLILQARYFQVGAQIDF